LRDGQPGRRAGVVARAVDGPAHVGAALLKGCGVNWKI
jgi:hypothetical protein